MNHQFAHNVGVARYTCRRYQGNGSEQKPFIFAESGIQTHTERFREHVFEAILHAATTMEGICHFEFTIMARHVYAVRLENILDLRHGVAVELSREIMRRSFTPIDVMTTNRPIVITFNNMAIIVDEVAETAIAAVMSQV